MITVKNYKTYRQNLYTLRTKIQIVQRVLFLFKQFFSDEFCLFLAHLRIAPPALS